MLQPDPVRIHNLDVQTFVESLVSRVMNDRLITELRKIANFSDEEIDTLQGYLSNRSIRKGDHFLNLGQVSRSIAFIDEGLLMHYSLHDGVEIPCNFSLEGDWTGSLKSLTSSSPTEIAIKALEDVCLREISVQHLEQLFLSSPQWLQFKTDVVQRVFFTITQHNADFAMLDAKARYYKFMQEKPHLVNRVPQYYIAAYLGIKPQSLSRIRNNR